MLRMQSKVEKLPNSRVKVSITATAADLAHATEHAIAHLTSQVTVKGFRPGKAPFSFAFATARGNRSRHSLAAARS